MFLSVVNEDDGCQLVEDAVRDVHFPPVRALHAPRPTIFLGKGQLHNDTMGENIQKNQLFKQWFKSEPLKIKDHENRSNRRQWPYRVKNR